MPILFSAVACDKKIDAKYAACDGNFKEILDEVLVKVPNQAHKMTYLHGPYLFHYIADQEYFYFCVTDKTCQRSRSFLFLNEIRRRFQQSRNNFTNVLADEMYRYSEDYSTIVIRKGEIDELNSIGVDSSESILGEKILYVNNPEDITFSTISYIQDTPVSVTQTSDTEEYPKNTNSRVNFIVVTVILVLLWLGISILGPFTFIMIACIFIFSFLRLSRVENKS